MQILAEILAADSERRADRHFRRFADLSRPLPGGGGGKGEGARTLEDSLALSLSLSLSLIPRFTMPLYASVTRSYCHL